ncbi:MAG TPA: DNA-binding response regulator, partial [Acidisarcina sp.]
MKRHVLICGIFGGVLIALLKWSEYQFLIIDHSIEIYGGLTAVIFAGFGIWLGQKLTAPKQTIVLKEVFVPAPLPAATPFVANETKREDLGITRREMEILGLIANGMSNR